MINRQKLVEDNLNLVYAIASKFTVNNSLYSYEDLIAIGNEGLVRASQTFDENKNIKFSTFAFLCIKNAILNELRLKQNKINYSNTVYMTSEIGQTGYAIDGDVLITLADIISTEDKNLENIGNKVLVDKLLKKCNDLERVVIDLFLSGYTIKDIARKLNRSVMGVTIILLRLKRHILEVDKMKLPTTEFTCPYCSQKLTEDIYSEGKLMKICTNCDKWWDTYEEDDVSGD